ncbi:MAG: rRNA (guanine-N1)-methyltransferase [Clostridia bacterium]|nr:MAG: rRNA (guanine-N1)-methyltransferase [Clostridia bacterium]
MRYDKGMKTCYAKFDVSGVFRCPLCMAPLTLSGQSLLCANGHCFDVSAKGYVNLAAGRGQSVKYDKALFESRGALLRDGFYAHVLDAVTGALALDVPRRVLDAGCGEGYYARALTQRLGAELYAFDLSRDAVMLAARGGSLVRLMVADMTNIPLQTGTMDAVLDAFSPAHYGEYARVLKPGGLLVKVIPAPEHLLELRRIAKGQLSREAYESGRDVEAHFSLHFHLFETREIARTLPLDTVQRAHLVRMTPLLFGVDAASLPLESLNEITIAARLLIGRVQPEACETTAK